MVRGKGTRSPLMLPSRLFLIWGLASYAVIILGLIIALADALNRWTGILLSMVAAASLIARFAVITVAVILERRSARRTERPSD